MTGELGLENCQFPFLRLFPRVLLFEELPPAALGFEAGAVLLLTEGLEAGAVERVVVVERVAVLRDGCFTCGAVLLCTFGLEAGVDFLLTDGLRAGVVERVIVVDRVVVLRDGELFSMRTSELPLSDRTVTVVRAPAQPGQGDGLEELAAAEQP